MSGDIVGGFFFFQAEDGIRDDLVTGVQTCALPISDEQRDVILLGIANLEHDLDERMERRDSQGPEVRPRVEAQAVRDRKSVVQGKSVGIGGSYNIIKQKQFV